MGANRSRIYVLDAAGEQVAHRGRAPLEDGLASGWSRRRGRRRDGCAEATSWNSSKNSSSRRARRRGPPGRISSSARSSAWSGSWAASPGVSATGLLSPSSPTSRTTGSSAWAADSARRGQPAPRALRSGAGGRCGPVRDHGGGQRLGQLGRVRDPEQVELGDVCALPSRAGERCPADARLAGARCGPATTGACRPCRSRSRPSTAASRRPIS